MYHPKYDIPLAVLLSLIVSLLASYLTADSTAMTERFTDSIFDGSMEPLSGMPAPDEDHQSSLRVSD